MAIPDEEIREAPKISIIELIKKHPDFQSVSWVIGCMSKCKDEKRFHITHLKVKGNCFTATDGNRVHHYESPGGDYTDGFYRVIKKNKSHIFLTSYGTDEKYPCTDDVLTPAKVKPFTVYRADWNCFFAYASIVRKLDEAILNYNFIDDLLNLRDAFDCYIKNDKSPVVFTNQNKKAAIMTMKQSL